MASATFKTDDDMAKMADVDAEYVHQKPIPKDSIELPKAEGVQEAVKFPSVTRLASTGLGEFSKRWIDHWKLSLHEGLDLYFERKISEYELIASLRNTLDFQKDSIYRYKVTEQLSAVRKVLINLHGICKNEERFYDFIRGILEKDDYSGTLPTMAERLQRLADYAKTRDDRLVQHYARLLFPEWSITDRHSTKVHAISEIALPTEAPESYQGLRGPETPPVFVQRVYGEWLGHGLTRAHIRNLDPVLYTAINNWLKKPGCEWPSNVDLPTLREQNDRWVDRVKTDGVAGALGSDATVKDYHRLTSVLGRRKNDAKSAR